MLGAVLLLTAVVPLLPGFDQMGQDLRAALRTKLAHFRVFPTPSRGPSHR